MLFEMLPFTVWRREQEEMASKKSKDDEEKKFVRYKEGAKMYGMSLRKFQDVVKDADALYKVGKMALVKVSVMDEYLETFKI